MYPKASYILFWWRSSILTLSVVSGTAPWITRVDEIKASTAVNVEAERRAAQLQDEIQSLVRNLKAKDQSIQESSVKIELMERRMETVKKQADAIADLESELGKVKKQERAYEEAIDQLQADLDALEQDNAKLKAMATGHEKQGNSFSPFAFASSPVHGPRRLQHRVCKPQIQIMFLQREALKPPICWIRLA